MQNNFVICIRYMFCVCATTANNILKTVAMSFHYETLSEIYVTFSSRKVSQMDHQVTFRG